MTIRSMRAIFALSAAAVLLLSGCSGAGTTVASSPATPPPTTASNPVELPPGDPGLDAPAVPDPGAPKGHDGHHDAARRVVPRESMLGSQMVSKVLGGQWHELTARPLGCTSELDEVAERTVAYESDGRRVLQTVATHRSQAAGDRAVRDMSRLLRGCGWTVHPDPRLGSASTAASNSTDTQTAVVVAAEGVTVTLVGSDGATAHNGRWWSLVDLALGNSCAAAPDGCH